MLSTVDATPIGKATSRDGKNQLIAYKGIPAGPASIMGESGAGPHHIFYIAIKSTQTPAVYPTEYPWPAIRKYSTLPDGSVLLVQFVTDRGQAVLRAIEQASTMTAQYEIGFDPRQFGDMVRDLPAMGHARG